MLEPIAPERDFLRRIMRRYGLDFVIIGELVNEENEYGTSELRDATRPELQMWYRIIPQEIQKKVNDVYILPDTDLVLEAVSEEVCGAVKYRKVIYLNAKDFAVLRNHPPKGLESVTEKHLLLMGHVATIEEDIESPTKIFVSRQIPQGYFLSMDEPDFDLNWRPASETRELQPKIEPFKYRLEPLLTPCDGY